MPDIRWGRPDIKSVSLLPNALARQKAEEAGANEAWLVDEQWFCDGRRRLQCLDRDGG